MTSHVDPAGPELRRRPAGAAAAADFSVEMTDDSMEPYIKRGETVYVTRRGPLKPGDAGIFCVGDRMVCRQYAEDSEGNIYLFAANRARRDLDITVPTGCGPVQFFGSLIPRLSFPLPGIE